MIDYDPIATEYAQHRQIHPTVLKNLMATGVISNTSPVLEIGCGTGNYIVALESESGGRGWGIDPSEAMLSRARSRSGPISCVSRYLLLWGTKYA